jgi:hypothetical protein
MMGLIIIINSKSYVDSAITVKSLIASHAMFGEMLDLYVTFIPTKYVCAIFRTAFRAAAKSCS